MVRVIGLDHLYVKIRKLILMVKGYTENSHIDYIFKMCRLKPYDTIFGKTEKIELHRWWIDEFGNSVHILKNKKIEIDFNDLNVDRSVLTSTDLYAGLSPHKLYMMSKVAYLLVGKERGQDHFILALLGIDDYLRTFIFSDGEWNSCSSLYLGMRVLRTIASNSELKNFKEWKTPYPTLFPCEKQRTWLSCIPIGDELKKMLPDNFLAYIAGDK